MVVLAVFVYDDVGSLFIFLPATARRPILNEQNSKRETLIYIVHTSVPGFGCS